MITKKELCEARLIDYAHKTLKMNHPIDITKIPENTCMSSSTIGVCMEYLGLINDPDLKEYISHRGGVMYMIPGSDGEPKIITFRDILDSMKE